MIDVNDRLAIHGFAIYDKELCEPIGLVEAETLEELLDKLGLEVRKKGFCSCKG